MKASGICFVTPDSRVLLLKRSADADHPGEWDLPGGLTRAGEEAYGGALREAREEIGETFEDGDASELAQTELDGVQFITFKMPVREEFKPRLNAEHTAFEWRSLANLPGKLHPGVKQALAKLPAQAQDTQLAFDRSSVRAMDQDGRLHVSLTNISKANVCPYYGSEIPNSEALGLLPDKVYNLLRSPDELAKAASTFNNIQLLSHHIPVSASDPQKDVIVGSTGTNAVFEAPYLKNSLVVWDAEAIAKIQSEEQRELSCGYRYRADMTPGNFEGAAYDGIMRDIVGNHVALVEQGRAGSDVVVGDSILETSMSNRKGLSRKAAMAKGALAVFLMPKLAQDAKIDLNKLLIGVTAANWQAKKSAIAAGLRAATAGKLAQDATLEELVEILDGLDKNDGPGMEDTPDDAGAPEASAEPGAEALPDAAGAPEDDPGTTAPPDDAGAPEADPGAPAEEAPAAAASPADQVCEFLAGKLSDEEIAQVRAMIGAGATDELPGMMGGEQQDEAALIARLKELLAKLGSPGESTQDEAIEGSAGGPPPTPGAPNPPGNLKEPEMNVNKAAMDSAIKAARAGATKDTMQLMRDISEAERIVRPFIGDLAIAQDSAAAVYKLALEKNGINLEGVHPSAYKAMVAMLPQPGAQPAQSAAIAQDSGVVVSFNKRFPGAARVRQLG